MSLCWGNSLPTLEPCATVIGHADRNHTCSTPTDQICGYCGEPVCIRCTLGCYECAVPLHEECREDHGKDMKHSIDVPVNN